MKYSMMAEASPNSEPESHVMFAVDKCSSVISNSYFAADDERRSRKYWGNCKNIIAPKVRVVYVYEPKIIKTNPENFLSLVQRLTGKSSHKSKEKKRKMNHKSPSSEVIVAEVGSENTLYSNDQRLIMKNKTTKFSTEDCSGFSKRFSDTDMVDQGLSCEIIAAEVGTKNLEYTF